MLKVQVSDEDHIQGPKNAPITLVEYGDYQCPYCGDAYPIIKQVQEHFGSQLRFVFRNFPLTEIHTMAEPAAQIAEYAGLEGLFWEMHDLIYENQSNLSSQLFFELADSLGLSRANVKKALTNQAIVQKIEKDFIGGVKSGVNGTPTLYLNGDRYEGPLELAGFVSAINKLKVKA